MLRAQKKSPGTFARQSRGSPERSLTHLHQNSWCFCSMKLLPKSSKIPWVHHLPQNKPFGGIHLDTHILSIHWLNHHSLCSNSFVSILMLYSPVICYIAIENGHRNFVSFPINGMVILHSYVSLPEGKSH